MNEDNEITEVIFRKFPEGDVIALFPYEISNWKGDIMSYQHVGQHGDCDYNLIVSKTKLATPEEYADLKKELETHYDYKFKVLKKMNHNKYSQAYYYSHIVTNA